MKKAEELCIKYLMNETDPDETAEIRAEMIADSDTLIEFESMRSTWSKVRELPTVQPPAYLTQTIVEQAAQARRFRFHALLTPATKWAAAAAVVGMVGFGAWTSYRVAENVQGDSQATTTGNTDHWVDKNDILIIQPNNAANAASNADLYQNADKLKPVVPSSGQPANNRDIRLTGSPVNR